MWTAICGIAMGSVVGALALLFTDVQSRGFWPGLVISVIFFAVTGACTFICVAIDANFDFFGGAQNPTQFILSGLVPALIGAGLYAWLLSSHAGDVIIKRAFG